ncbi:MULTISPECIES: GNAT family N-acetyltransferase [unclassified Romboutsia]|uniref:GNAT family N-acetyltransferase n=1 Tax=unclassified Romboutsia TaxID=2626894 RepID=UPI000821D5BB|nr:MULTISPECIES: GNAT family N-acetyltransferase [unclassified Romboutsia]SCG98010.1 Predicted acetyltransferase [uncultured Clostridium sp.]
MITKVNESLEKAFWEYVSHEERINLFIIGDVENYGLNTEFQEVWFQICNEKIAAVMLRYYKSLVIYSYENDFDVDEMISHINTLDIKEISGKKSVIDKLLDGYEDYKEFKETYFCSLKSLNNIETLVGTENKIQKAEVKDLEELNKFLSQIDGMHAPDYIPSKTKQLNEKNTRIYFVKDNDKIISTVSTGIETSFLAMICGVGTDINYRNKGLATYMVYTLSKELFNEGKVPCLFYNNEYAGRIYKKIGYEVDDKWSILLK